MSEHSKSDNLLSCDDFGKLIESMTTSGSLGINGNDLKTLKHQCRHSDDDTERAFRMLWHQMGKHHSQIRLSTLIIMNELFLRSHLFRTLMVENLHELFEMILDVNPQKKLPKPLQYQNQLKSKAIEFIDNWNKLYGDGYAMLKAAYKYLKEKKVNFNDRTVIQVNELEMRRADDETIRRRHVMQSNVTKAIEELNDVETDVRSLLTQINSCFELLIPRMDVNDSGTFDNENLKRVKPSEDPLNIVVKPFIEIPHNDDTDAVIENLRDVLKQLISINQLKLKRLLRILSKGSDLCETQLKKAIDLKWSIECAKQKYYEISIVKDNDLNSDNDSSDDDDDDFIEVPPKEDIELIMSEHRRRECGLESLPQPSSSSSSVSSSSSAAAASKHPSTSKSHDIEMVRCNAPLENGKLCPRRDAIKCPFHGKIIARDMFGSPLNDDDRRRENERKANEVPEWQNPVLLREIKAVTGIDLSMDKCKKRKKKYPGLKSVRDADNTARKRLSKIIFKKDAIQRVSDDLNARDDRRDNHFEDQWNYALQT